MNTKLTLRMDEALITTAKAFAAAHGSSVSQIVANYFAALGHLVAVQPGTETGKNTSQAASSALKPDKLGPVTRSLVGILKAKPGQPQVNEEDYHAYLERKYLGGDGTSQTGIPS